MIASMRVLSPAGAGIFLMVCLWAAPGLTGERDLWLEVDVPVSGATQVGPVGLVLVRGFAGVGLGHDVVLLIDTSGSTLDPSGFDVDLDGKVGRRLRSADDPYRSLHPRRQCNDPGDTVRAAELDAASKLASELSQSGRARLAVVGFDGAARTLAPLGEPVAAAAAAVAALDGSLKSGWSDLAGALEHAADLLDSPGAEAHPEADRTRSIILLSDGLAQSRGVESERAERAVVQLAADLGKREIRVHTFGLVPPEHAGTQVLADIAERSGGQFVAVPDPEKLVSHLLQVGLAPLEALEVRNASANLPARAVRISPDGAFDGIVPLLPGRNRIEVIAHGPGAPPRRIERTVQFEPRQAKNLEEARAVAADLDELRRRTLELELAATVERGRLEARERVLELEAGGRSLRDGEI